jgi:hypothetical protein
MDFKALIEFNKYTIALSAVCLAYAIDKFTPIQAGGWFVLLVLALFFLCTLSGVVVFASATSALHEEKKAKVPALKRLIAPLGTAHVCLLIAGIIALGSLVLARVTMSTEPAKGAVCCEVCKK